MILRKLRRDTKVLKASRGRSRQARPQDSQRMSKIVWFGNRICVPNKIELKNLILQEAHDTPYSIHPGGTKMYQDLKERFWWHGMKREIAAYVAKCDV